MPFFSTMTINVSNISLQTSGENVITYLPDLTPITVLIDSFTRGGGESSPYPITGHTGESGTWTLINPDPTSINSSARLNTNNVFPYNNTGGNAIYLNSYSVASQNYSVKISSTIGVNSVYNGVGLVSRSQANRGYIGRVYGISSAYSCDIIKWTATNTFTVLTSLSSIPLTNTATYEIELETINNYINLYVKNSSNKYLSKGKLWSDTKSPVIQTTDSTYTNGGVSVFIAGNDSSGWSIDSYNYIYNTVGIVNMVTVGDSLTLGNVAPSLTYPQALSTILGKKFKVNNQGIGSTTLTNMISNGSTIDTLYQPGKDNILIVWGGTNDIYFGGSGSTAYSDLVSYCNARKTTGWTVILLNALSRSDTSVPSTFLDDKKTFNNLIDTNWQSISDFYIDLEKDNRIGYDGAELDTTYFISDKVHLNNTGNQIIAEYVGNLLLKGV
jgi:lysophospholipase L1-like esterase